MSPAEVAQELSLLHERDRAEGDEEREWLEGTIPGVRWRVYGSSVLKGGKEVGEGMRWICEVNG